MQSLQEHVCDADSWVRVRRPGADAELEALSVDPRFRICRHRVGSQPNDLAQFSGQCPNHEAILAVRVDPLRVPGPDPSVYQGLDQISCDGHSRRLVNLHHSPPLIDCAMSALMLRSSSLAADWRYFACPSRDRTST